MNNTSRPPSRSQGDVLCPRYGLNPTFDQLESLVPLLHNAARRSFHRQRSDSSGRIDTKGYLGCRAGQACSRPAGQGSKGEGI